MISFIASEPPSRAERVGPRRGVCISSWSGVCGVKGTAASPSARGFLGYYLQRGAIDRPVKLYQGWRDVLNPEGGRSSVVPANG